MVEADNEAPALSMWRERRQAAAKSSATDDPDRETDGDDVEVEHTPIPDKKQNKAGVENKTAKEVHVFYFQSQ